MKLRVFCYAIIVCAFFNRTAFSQEAEKGTIFYQKDFVHEGMKEGSAASVPTPEEVKEEPAEKPAELDSSIKPFPKVEDPKPLSNADPDAHTAPSAIIDLKDMNPAVQPRTIKVNSIGAVLNAVDSAHFAAKMTELVEVLQKFDFGAGTIYSVGFLPAGEATTQLGGLLVRGGDVRAVGHVPYKYHVEKSPTWILGTDDGEIVLEGVEPLLKQFNQKGEFLDYSDTEGNSEVMPPLPAKTAAAADGKAPKVDERIKVITNSQEAMKKALEERLPAAAKAAEEGAKTASEPKEE